MLGFFDHVMALEQAFNDFHTVCIRYLIVNTCSGTKCTWLFSSLATIMECLAQKSSCKNVLTFFDGPYIDCPRKIDITNKWGGIKSINMYFIPR